MTPDPLLSADREREALRALSEAATPGPWAGCAHVAGTDTDCPCRYRGDVVSTATDEVLLQMRVGPDEHPGAPDDDSWKGVKTTDLEQGYVDGRFIVAAVNYVRAALSSPETTPAPDAGLRDILDRVPATAERLQYVNPNVREDAYNKGVRDLAESIANALATLPRQGEAGLDVERLRKIEVAARDYAADKPVFDKQWHQDNCPERGDFVRWYADRQRASERLAAKFDILAVALGRSGSGGGRG